MKSYTITVNGNVYDVTVEEKSSRSSTSSTGTEESSSGTKGSPGTEESSRDRKCQSDSRCGRKSI